MNMLLFGRYGYCLLSKLLERGTFEEPEVAGDARQFRLDATALSMWMDEVALRAPRRRRYDSQASRGSRGRSITTTKRVSPWREA